LNIIGPLEGKSEKEESIFVEVTQVDPHFRFRVQAFPVRVKVVSGRQIVPISQQNMNDENDETEEEKEIILKNLVLNDVLENILESLENFCSNLESNSPQK